MKIYILGVGDAFSSINYNTCFIVQSEDGFNLAVECPHPYLKILQDIRKINNKIPKIENIDNFVITHLHSDHCSGLETLGFYKKFIEQKKLGVIMSWNDHQNHRDMVVPSMGTTLVDDKIIKVYPYDYFEYDFLGELVQCGPFQIRSRKTDHYIPAHALLISDGKHTVGFSGDTKFDRDLIEWLNQADFILHETGPAPRHSPLSDLLSLPSRIKRKTRLIHYNDYLSTDAFALAGQGNLICLGGVGFDEEY